MDKEQFKALCWTILGSIVVYAVLGPIGVALMLIILALKYVADK